MLLDKFLIFNTGGIKLPKEQMSSIYQWPVLLQHLLHKQFYTSDNVCGSINTNSTKVFYFLNPKEFFIVFLIIIRKMEVILKVHCIT